VLLVERHGDVVVGELPGPANPFTEFHEELTVPFVARVNAAERRVWFDFGGNELWLDQGEYSDWITVTFRPGLGVKVRGIVRLLVTSVSPHFELYVTPINIDPESPVMPVSEPGMFAQYLAKLQGKYATLGLAEDTWALNEGVLDDAAFLEQTYLIHDERERMFLNSLRKNRSGFTAVVFDATDRIQHTFFRVLDPSHPANRGKPPTAHAGAIEDLYVRMDKLLARVLDEVDEKTLLMVISDHGFKPFRRGVNLNRWFIENGYMTAADGAVGEYLAGVDWGRTRAYQLGLSGIYLNRKGREAKGIVTKDDVAALKRELKGKLTGLRDPQTGEVAITSVYDVAEMMSGPYAAGAPDLIIGYNVGYRASWDAAVGKSSDSVLEDNTKPWSGDHCIDYRLAPGVLFCNRKVRDARPRLMDIGPSVLEAFGVPVPEYMQGRSVFRGDGDTGEGGR
jgi:hypothetical protein